MATPLLSSSETFLKDFIHWRMWMAVHYRTFPVSRLIVRRSEIKNIVRHFKPAYKGEKDIQLFGVRIVSR